MKDILELFAFFVFIGVLLICFARVDQINRIADKIFDSAEAAVTPSKKQDRFPYDYLDLGGE